MPIFDVFEITHVHNKEKFAMSSALNSKKTIVISAIVFILSLMPIESFAGKDWEVVSQLPTKRLDFTTIVVDDKIYLIGGSLYEDAKLGRRIPGPFGSPKPVNGSRRTIC